MNILQTTPGHVPCYMCEDRTVDCHSNCPKYLEWKKNNDKLQAAIRAKHKKY